MRTTGQRKQADERAVISTFHVAESMGFKGEFRQWSDRSTKRETGMAIARRHGFGRGV